MKNEINYLEILKTFCADEEYGRYVMTRPFNRDGFATATNGHIAAFVPNDLCEVEENLMAPKAVSIIPKDISGNWTVAVASLRTDSLDTDLAAYRAYLGSRCRHCNGEGEHHCKCGDEHECFACDGSGLSGETKFAPSVRIANNAFSYDYVTRIREAAEILNASEILYSESGANNASLFEIGEVRIVLMPLRDPVEATPLFSVKEVAAA